MKLISLKYVKLVSDASGWSLGKSFIRMNNARTQHNVSFEKYYKKEFYLRPETTVSRKAQSILAFNSETDQLLQDTCTSTGLTEEYLINDREEFCKLYTIGLRTYLRWRVYELSAEERIDLAKKFKVNEETRADIAADIAVVDRSTLDMAALEKRYADYKEFLEGFITEETFTERAMEYLEVATDKDDKNMAHDIVVDLEATRYIFGLTAKEYYMFRLWEKSFADKMDYIPNVLHTGMMLYINGYHLVDVCNEKYDTYCTLKPYYCRDMIRVSSKKDYSELASFIEKHNKGVFKPLTQTKGEGVQLLKFEEEIPNRSTAAIKDYIQGKIEEYGDFVIEELIVANPEFSRINPDAINTVRALVYYDGTTIKYDGALFRVGRKGSFVDNGALGGILMDVDPDKGIVTKPGADQAGHFYEEHPDTGVKLVGYQLPDWDKAKTMLKAACETIGPGYIGWDITYTANEDWVIVEANGTPQQYGIQSSTGKGALPHFANTVGIQAYEAYANEQKRRSLKFKNKALNNGDEFGK